MRSSPLQYDGNYPETKERLLNRNPDVADEIICLFVCHFKRLQERSYSCRDPSKGHAVLTHGEVPKPKHDMRTGVSYVPQALRTGQVRVSLLAQRLDVRHLRFGQPARQLSGPVANGQSLPGEKGSPRVWLRGRRIVYNLFFHICISSHMWKEYATSVDEGYMGGVRPVIKNKPRTHDMPTCYCYGIGYDFVHSYHDTPTTYDPLPHILCVQ